MRTAGNGIHADGDNIPLGVPKHRDVAGQRCVEDDSSIRIAAAERLGNPVPAGLGGSVYSEIIGNSVSVHETGQGIAGSIEINA